MSDQPSFDLEEIWNRLDNIERALVHWQRQVSAEMNAIKQLREITDQLRSVSAGMARKAKVAAK
jgi:hypothetical protein